MSAPETEAGRALLGAIRADLDEQAEGTPTQREEAKESFLAAILAIEEQARAAAPHPTAPPNPLEENRPMDSLTLIAVERARQVLDEGYTADHDTGHAEELAAAAGSYALPEAERPKDFYATGVPATWPWEGRYWKPTPDDRRRELVKAGALIVAALDALTEGGAK